MKRLLALLLLLFSIPVVAEDIELPTYGCAVTLPPGEGWVRGSAQKLPVGEIVLNASRTEANQLFILTVLPNIPSDDVESPGVINRVLETLSTVGYRSGEPEMIKFNGMKCAQFFARRQQTAPGDLVAVARALLKDKTIYLMLMIGPGDEGRTKDVNFLRVMESFRFLEAVVADAPNPNHPLYPLYKLGAFVCVGLVGVLAFLYLSVILVTRRRSDY